jgi:NTP pyrophosphatase (non-canonical NTP hydrolase)
MEPRPIIKVVDMKAELKMQLHDAEKGDSWKTCEIDYLRQKLCEEVAEALNVRTNNIQQSEELADVVAVCAMLSARLRWQNGDD